MTALSLSWCCRARGQEQVLLRTVEQIGQEATRSNQGDAGRPLLLAAHWNSSGAYNEGFMPEYQLQPDPPGTPSPALVLGPCC